MKIIFIKNKKLDISNYLEIEFSVFVFAIKFIYNILARLRLAVIIIAIYIIYSIKIVELNSIKKKLLIFSKN